MTKPHPLTNIELILIMKKFNVNNFRCLMKNELPLIEPNFSYIINTDNNDSLGSHWVCMYNDHRLSHILFFDSLGSAPCSVFYNFMKKANKPILYNSSILQSLNTVTCGFYCVYILLELNDKVSFYDIIYRLTQQPSLLNESFIFKILNNLLKQ